MSPATARCIGFRYTVQAGETDADGIVSASAIDLNGGTIGMLPVTMRR